ncbi:auxin efflux carrier [Tessaracoccus lubricantis]|uniref:Auxin efflux carrier n=1 Tax=Tessaracoccus lubricantis TaxID=545543 RepID=A0ABP9F387_9ACTN
MSSALGPTLAGIVPILLLIGLGVLLRHLGVLDGGTAEGLKRLVVNVVLPAVLFLAFLGLEFQPEYLTLVVMVPLLCLVLLGVGRLARRWLKAPPVATFLFTGFEFGMVGLALFTAAYGMEFTPVAAIVGLGHEFFIWFVFVTLLRRQSDGGVGLGQTLRSFITSPVIIAILAGLLLNAVGAREALESNVLSAALLTTATYLAAIIVPVILILVGHGSRLSADGVRTAAPFVAARFVVCLALAVLVSWGIVGQWLGLGPAVQAAVFMLLILPPPFIVPIFLPAHRADEVAYSNNVLSLYTLVSVAAFVTYVAVVPSLS